jgi:hypothetical protein
MTVCFGCWSLAFPSVHSEPALYGTADCFQVRPSSVSTCRRPNRKDMLPHLLSPKQSRNSRWDQRRLARPCIAPEQFHLNGCFWMCSSMAILSCAWLSIEHESVVPAIRSRDALTQAHPRTGGPNQIGAHPSS